MKRRSDDSGRAALVLWLGCVLTAAAAATGEPRVWCHLVPWNAINNMSHNRLDFPLGAGMEAWPGMPRRPEPQRQADYVQECLLARNAGIDVFAVDLVIRKPLRLFLPALDGYMDAADTVYRETGQRFWATGCLDGVGGKTPQALADLIAEVLRGRATRSAWPLLEGHPVLWTYDGTTMSADDWQSTFGLLQQMGYAPIIVLDANSLYRRIRPAEAPGATAQWSGLPVGELDIYAALPVILYPFRTDFNRASEARCRAYLETRHPASLAARKTVGTLWPGYWSLTSGWLVDPECTGRLRETCAASAQTEWLNVTTWNDFLETTHVQPSTGLGSVRIELIQAFVSRWKGDASWPSQARVHVWQPTDLAVGTPEPGEILVLAPDNPVWLSLEVHVACGGDPGVRVLFEAGDVSGIRAFPFDVVVDSMPDERWLDLRVTVSDANGMVHVCRSPPIPVWPAGYTPAAVPRGTAWRMGTQEPDALHLDVAGDDRPETVTVSAPSGAPLETLFVRRNIDVMHVRRRPTFPVAYDMGREYRAGTAPWELYPAIEPGLRWGFVDALAVGSDGLVRRSSPVWVAPPAGTDLSCVAHWGLDAEEGAHAVDAGLYGLHGRVVTEASEPEWGEGRTAARRALRLDGVDDFVRVPGGRLPPHEFTVCAWVRPTPEDNTFDRSMGVYVDINGPVILMLDSTGRPRVKRAGTPDAEVIAEKPVVPGTWSHIAVTCDGQFLSLFVNGEHCGRQPCSSARRSNLTAIGCNPYGARSAFFRGDIDEVTVFSRPLTPEDIATRARP